MTRDRDEERLRQAFQELRTETGRGRGVPAFDAMLAEAERRAEERPALEVVAGGAPVRTRRRLVRIGAWASAAVAATVAGLVLVDTAPGGEAEFERLVAAYASQTGPGLSSPTSGLLDVPGLDLVRSVPSIGAPVRGLDPSSRPAAPSSPEEENL